MMASVARAKAAGLRRWYNVRALAEGERVYVAAEDYQLLRNRIAAERLGAGDFYLSDLVVTPAWTLDASYVNTLRRRIQRARLREVGLGR